MYEIKMIPRKCLLNYVSNVPYFLYIEYADRNI